MITDLTKLDINQIVELLEMAGYNESSSDIVGTTFVKVCGNGNIQYRIEYYDIDRNLMDDYVYVFIDSDGKLTADY